MIVIDFVKKKVRKLIKSNIGSYNNPKQLTYSQVEENPTWYYHIFYSYTLILLYWYKLQFYENENITQIGLLTQLQCCECYLYYLMTYLIWWTHIAQHVTLFLSNFIQQLNVIIQILLIS